jgi:glycosyltransferase involved in cell wall biosynthesis
MGWLGARLLGRALVVNPHLGGPEGDVARLMRRPAVGRLRLGRLGRDADAFVAISGQIAAELLASAIPARKVHRLANAVDTTTFRPVDPGARGALRQRLGLPPARPVAVYVGRLTRTKGLLTLLEAWERVPAPAELVVVGAGDLEPELRARADHRLPGRVRFAGVRHDVHEYLQAADAWTLPSFGEGLPMSLLEAMATGLPVVTTPVGGIVDVVRAGDNGLLVEPGQAAALASALGRALAAGEDARRMGRRARETVLARFGLPSVGQAYLDLFERVRRARG